MEPTAIYSVSFYHHSQISVKMNMEVLWKTRCDPQTSGGLLVSVPENQSKEILDELQQSGVSQARIIGAVQTLGETHLKIL